MAEKLTKAEERYWRKMADEPLKFVKVPKEVQDEYNRTHPLPTKEELRRVQLYYEGKIDKI